jgi:hypothetical protein
LRVPDCSLTVVNYCFDLQIFSGGTSTRV